MAKVESAKDIPVKVEGVIPFSQGPAVMLVPSNAEHAEKDRVLPIFIDPTQAANIQAALEGTLAPRPMTHDLFSAVLNELGAIVEKVVIEDLAQNTFYATLYVEVERPDGKVIKKFDARPSDCIALAVRVGAPIEVTRKLLESASVARSEVGMVAEKDADDDVDLGVGR